jgi:hypothetical protein
MAQLVRAGAACVCLLLAGGAAPALASASHRVPLLSPDGSIHRRAVPAAAMADLPAPQHRRAPHARRGERATTAAHRTALSVLRRLHTRGRIDDAEYAARRRSYHRALHAARQLSGTRRSELKAVIASLNGIAARGQLTPSRLAPLWLTLDRNREWWTTAPWIPSSGERVGFTDDDLVWQYYPGAGLQIQWLGTFGKLNWLATRKSKRLLRQASRLVDQVLPLASWRAGGWAWEYEFFFDGGAPPWTSGMSQGTALQALARAVQSLDRADDIMPVARRAVTVFEVRPPRGVRMRTGRGRAHYVQYSFAPRLRIINGFIQSLIGLYDYAKITGDATAQRLFEEGERQAIRELPRYDTGAWSLYSRGTSTHESDVHYHVLLRDFLLQLCDRTEVAVFCDTAQRFTDDLTTPPVVTIPWQRPRAGRWQLLRLHLDKMSALTVTVRRGDDTVLYRSLGTLAYGTIRVGWSVPRRAGRYQVQVGARDLAGNTSQASRTIRVRRHG